MAWGGGGWLCAWGGSPAAEKPGSISRGTRACAAVTWIRDGGFKSRVMYTNFLFFTWDQHLLGCACVVVVVVSSLRIEALAAPWALKARLLLLLLSSVSTFTDLLLPQNLYYFIPSATVLHFLLLSLVWKVAPAVSPAGSGR